MDVTALDARAVTARANEPGAGEAISDREVLVRLAKEFEAILTTQLIRQMRQSMMDATDDQGLGAGTLTDAFDIEIGQLIAANGGFGLMEQLSSAFERQTLGGGASLAADADATALESVVPTPIAGPMSNAPVTSGFGMRIDPLNQQVRFHRGIDIAAAYGADVRAAAAGRIVFAGEQGGYGHTVLIDHGGGHQTRYAHLSEALVRAGDVVAEGGLVGRAGSSGRSTGPHLHFEVLVNGQPVDPAGR